MLGLVAMATTVDCLYASVKALVCAVEGNDMALKDMARTGGFKVCGGGRGRGWNVVVGYVCEGDGTFGGFQVLNS